MGLAIIIRLLEILIVAAALYITARLIISAFLKNEERNREAGKKKEYDQTMLPLKLQASERMILLLERISPSFAINRALEPGMTSPELQLILLKNIREEFDHNVAQQLYVSPACWSLVRNAKEEVTRIVNMAALDLTPESSAAELARLIIEKWSTLDLNPVQAAIDQIKAESL